MNEKKQLIAMFLHAGIQQDMTSVKDGSSIRVKCNENDTDDKVVFTFDNVGNLVSVSVGDVT